MPSKPANVKNDKPRPPDRGPEVVTIGADDSVEEAIRTIEMASTRSPILASGARRYLHLRVRSTLHGQPFAVASRAPLADEPA